MHPIKKYKLSKGVTYKSIAEKAGVSRHTIYKILIGERYPGIITAMRLVKVCGNEFDIHDIINPIYKGVI